MVGNGLASGIVSRQDKQTTRTPALTLSETIGNLSLSAKVVS
jgi:hypothetical protein